MKTTRRQFLVGSAAVAALPSVFTFAAATHLPKEKWVVKVRLRYDGIWIGYLKTKNGKLTVQWGNMDHAHIFGSEEEARSSVWNLYADASSRDKVMSVGTTYGKEMTATYVDEIDQMKDGVKVVLLPFLVKKEPAIADITHAMEERTNNDLNGIWSCYPINKQLVSTPNS